MQFPDIQQPSNIYIPGLPGLGLRPYPEPDHRKDADKERNRYSDEEVALLPDISPSHARYRYWCDRKRSSARLIDYLSLKKRSASILEIGCGNGWLSFQLSTVPCSRVIGIDIDYSALRQAAGVFRHQPNLKFMYGDLCSDMLQGLTFDIIVFAASIHHMPSIPAALDAAIAHLTSNGEIHIIDTPILFPKELKIFDHRYLYNPKSFFNRLAGKGKGFPWIVVTREHTKG